MKYHHLRNFLLFTAVKIQQMRIFNRTESVNIQVHPEELSELRKY